MNLRLESPWALLGLIPVCTLVVVLVWRARSAREPNFRFSVGLLEGLPRTFAARFFWLPDALRVLAMAALVLALSRPQWIGPPEQDDAQGIDIMLAIDTSCSMRAADFQPKDRMFVAKKSIEHFILGRKTDRIGLVVFGGEAASWAPLTLDYSLLAQLLEEVEVGMLPDGTAIGSAIGTALNRLRGSEAPSRVVVLLTDGDSNAGELAPKQAAGLAKELGVRIYTILIGKGGPVPFPSGKDLFGRAVFSQQVIPINPELLREIAALTGGEAYQATDQEELDEGLNQVLDSLEKSRLDAAVAAEHYQELFPEVLALSLFLLALELLLRTTRFRRFP